VPVSHAGAPPCVCIPSGQVSPCFSPWPGIVKRFHSSEPSLAFSAAMKPRAPYSPPELPTTIAPSSASGASENA